MFFVPHLVHNGVDTLPPPLISSSKKSLSPLVHLQPPTHPLVLISSRNCILNTTNVTLPLQVSCATKNVTRIKLELSVCQSFVSFLRLESDFNASNSILFVKLPAKSQNCAVSLPGAQNFIMVLFRFKKPKMQAFIFKDT